MIGSVGVVMVTHNSAADVLTSLRALPLQELAATVVVDNASTDGTADLVAGSGLPGVTVLRRENDGFGAGCNAGLAALPDVPVVLFLNPDAVLGRDQLERLLGHLRAHPEAAVVAPRLFRNGEPLRSAGRCATARSELRFVLPSRLSRLIPDRRWPANFDRTGPVGVVEGACMLVDAAVLRQLGGFDPSYFLFFEEHDLARRLARLRREVHLCAAASADHAVGASRTGLPSHGRDHYFESTFRYLRRWSGARSARAVSVVARMTWAWQVRTGRLSADDGRRFRAAAARGLGRP